MAASPALGGYNASFGKAPSSVDGYYVINVIGTEENQYVLSVR